MPGKKIVDETEVTRWIEQGKPYSWMVEQYATKYNLQVWPTTFSNFRRRKGMDNRVNLTGADLKPWRVRSEHRFRNAIVLLRLESRRRNGETLPEAQVRRLDAWITRMRAEGVVVHYDPTTPAGFSYVPARKGIDTDLVRNPNKRGK